jgi:hypothetical protein
MLVETMRRLFRTLVSGLCYILYPLSYFATNHDKETIDNANACTHCLPLSYSLFPSSPWAGPREWTLHVCEPDRHRHTGSTQWGPVLREWSASDRSLPTKPRYTLLVARYFDCLDFPSVDALQMIIGYYQQTVDKQLLATVTVRVRFRIRVWHIKKLIK